jgi:ACS family hexuronate transporter-like MFS transporter
LIIGPITVRLGWEAAFLVTGGLCVVWIPFWLFFSGSKSVNLGAEAARIAAGSDDAPQRLNFKSYAIQAVLLATFFTVVPTVFMNAFLALFLKDTYHLAQEQINGLQWKPFLATDIGQLGGGFAVFLLVRSGWKFLSARRLMLTIGFCGSALMFCVATAPDADSAVGWICASRLFFQAAYTVLGVYGIEAVHENQTALMAGLLNATFSISNFIFNPIIGWMSDKYGYGPVVTMISIAPLLGLGGWLVLSHLHARQQERELQQAAAVEMQAAPMEITAP